MAVPDAHDQQIEEDQITALAGEGVAARGARESTLADAGGCERELRLGSQASLPTPSLNLIWHFSKHTGGHFHCHLGCQLITGRAAARRLLK